MGVWSDFVSHRTDADDRAIVGSRIGRAPMDEPMADSTVSLVSGSTTATLDLLGGRLTSLVVDGLELLVREGCDVFHWGSFPMAPWAGRLSHGCFEIDGTVVELPTNSPPHALHGLVTEQVWNLLAVDHRSVGFAVDLGRAPSDPWPWPSRVVQSLSLGEHCIDFQLAVHADKPMPAHMGWHPWFSRKLRPDDPASAKLEIQSGQVYLNDPEGLPSGEMAPPPPPPWDYCFVGLAESPRVRWPGVLELTIDSDCDHWVLYDMEPAGICVEPWTGPPNCLNGPNPPIVTPEHPLQASMSWSWRRLGG
jgi:aldose 1-epimerase